LLDGGGLLVGRAPDPALVEVDDGQWGDHGIVSSGGFEEKTAAEGGFGSFRTE
jgi:hypothetical protein